MLARLDVAEDRAERSKTLPAEHERVRCGAEQALDQPARRSIPLRDGEERMHEPLPFSARRPAGTATELHANRFRSVPLHLMRSDRQTRGFVGNQRSLQPSFDYGTVLLVRGAEHQIVDLNEEKRPVVEQRPLTIFKAFRMTGLGSCRRQREPKIFLMPCRTTRS